MLDESPLALFVLMIRFLDFVFSAYYVFGYSGIRGFAYLALSTQYWFSEYIVDLLAKSFNIALRFLVESVHAQPPPP